MPEPRIIFDHVWKKFRRGEPHDSLRDLIPAMAAGFFRRSGGEALHDEEFWALSDVSFEVRPGETLGIIGRNGAGKSTSLKLLTRILRPTRGRAEVRGRVGALIELAAGFHPDLTGRENVFLQGAIMGMRRHEIARHLDRIVDFAGVGAFIDTQIKRYSSGMQARLGFSVAAHLEPDVLLIDEVLAVGDLSFQQKCYERLREFRRSGVAIAFVSHNMQAVSMLCDRAVLLRPGVSPVVGGVADVVRQYVSGLNAAGDPRIADVQCTLTRRGSASPVLEPVAPGAWLRLECAFTAGVALPRMGFGMTVRRADGLIVFQSGSTMGGLGTRDVGAGERVRCAVEFRANLLRGTYMVEPLLYDERRQWPNAVLESAAAFVVAETTRNDGVAELEPTYEFVAAAEVASAAS
jgi:lipopolysaccharide transport system ATP-binding protein